MRLGPPNFTRMRDIKPDSKPGEDNNSSRMLLTLLLVAVLPTASTVLASPTIHRRAPTLSVYESCTQPNDIALTFDDGPYIYLRQISDAFTNAGAKVTFFFNGNNWDCIYNPARISDIQYAYKAGHMIGSHTWSHADLLSLSTAQIQDAMYRVEEAFSRIIGIKPAFMRPPFGDYNSNVQNIAFSRGQNLALWDWDTGDADGNTTSQSEAVYNQVANGHLSNALILEHETEESTANTLVPYAINLFQSKGYKLVTLAQCLGVQPYAAVGVPQQQTSSWTCDGTPDPGEACGGSIPCSTGTPIFSTTTSSGPQPTQTNQVIHPNGNSGKCLTASTNVDGAAVEIDDCSGGASQSWTIAGSIIQLYGSKCLDVTDGTAADGTKMQIWTCSTNNPNQQWAISGNTVQWSGSSFCLDNTAGVLTNGNQVQIWSCTGGGNQQWQITSGSSAPTGHVIHPGSSSTTCLSAPTNANNAAVVVEPCDGSASQSWMQSGSTFVIYGNKCLDVTNGNTTNGNKMQIYTCNAGNVNQEFSVTADNRIAWTNHGECLDLTGGSLANGNAVQMWACTDNNNNQVWIIV